MNLFFLPLLALTQAEPVPAYADPDEPFNDKYSPFPRPAELFARPMGQFDPPRLLETDPLSGRALVSSNLGYWSPSNDALTDYAENPSIRAKCFPDPYQRAEFYNLLYCHYTDVCKNITYVKTFNNPNQPIFDSITCKNSYRVGNSCFCDFYDICQEKVIPNKDVTSLFYAAYTNNVVNPDSTDTLIFTFDGCSNITSYYYDVYGQMQSTKFWTLRNCTHSMFSDYIMISKSLQVLTFYFCGNLTISRYYASNYTNPNNCDFNSRSCTLLIESSYYGYPVSHKFNCSYIDYSEATSPCVPGEGNYCWKKNNCTDTIGKITCFTISTGTKDDCNNYIYFNTCSEDNVYADFLPINAYSPKTVCADQSCHIADNCGHVSFIGCKTNMTNGPFDNKTRDFCNSLPICPNTTLFSCSIKDLSCVLFINSCTNYQFLFSCANLTNTSFSNATHRSLITNNCTNQTVFASNPLVSIVCPDLDFVKCTATHISGITLDILCSDKSNPDFNQFMADYCNKNCVDFSLTACTVNSTSCLFQNNCTFQNITKICTNTFTGSYDTCGNKNYSSTCLGNYVIFDAKNANPGKSNCLSQSCYVSDDCEHSKTISCGISMGGLFDSKTLSFCESLSICPNSTVSGCTLQNTNCALLQNQCTQRSFNFPCANITNTSFSNATHRSLTTNNCTNVTVFASNPVVSIVCADLNFVKCTVTRTSGIIFDILCSDKSNPDYSQFMVDYCNKNCVDSPQSGCTVNSTSCLFQNNCTLQSASKSCSNVLDCSVSNSNCHLIHNCTKSFVSPSFICSNNSISLTNGSCALENNCTGQIYPSPCPDFCINSYNCTVTNNCVAGGPCTQNTQCYLSSGCPSQIGCQRWNNCTTNTQCQSGVCQSSTTCTKGRECCPLSASLFAQGHVGSAVSSPDPALSHFHDCPNDFPLESVCQDTDKDCGVLFTKEDICSDPAKRAKCKRTCCECSCSAKKNCSDFVRCNVYVAKRFCSLPKIQYLCQKSCGFCLKNSCSYCK